MDQNQNKKDLANFSDINDEIIFKEEDGDFKLFSKGNLADFEFKKKEESVLPKAVLDTGLEEKQLAPSAPVVWDKKAAFYFDTKDEEEVAKEKKKISQITKDEQKKYSINKIVQKIINSFGLELMPQLENKLFFLIASFLKHTREKIDVLNILKATINQGGIGLESNIARQIVDLLVSIREKIEESKGIVVEDREIPKQVRKVEKLSNLDPRQKVNLKKSESTIPVMRRNNLNKNKATIADIKRKERIVGPMDELAEMNLTTFRRIAQSPVEAVQKIIDKIKSFEKESYIKKAQAIQSWRKSEIYKLYLDLGRASIEENKPIKSIIEQKILAKEKVLTVAEFEAVSDLNKKLRF